MEFFKYFGGREVISCDELKEIFEKADSPADLIDLTDRLGLNLGFAEVLSAIWRKKFDDRSDLLKLNTIVAKGLK